MIKYIEWGQHLRLGNWLFLYAGIQSISKQAENRIYYPLHWMWEYFEKLPFLIGDNGHDEIFHFKLEKYSPELKREYVNYFKENRNKVININLGSHLQSEKWFIEDIEYIKSILKLKQERVDEVKEKYKHFFDKPTIGIGIRRGDFVNHGVFYQIPETWYLRALEANFNKNDYNVVVFSDDIEWCKNYYKNENFMYVEPNNTHTHAEGFKHYRKDPFEQFALASIMENFIGGSSTFTWWNMWYVKNFNNGKVIHSGKNLSDKGEKQFGVNSDYYPETWVKFDI